MGTHFSFDCKIIVSIIFLTLFVNVFNFIKNKNIIYNNTDQFQR